MEIPQGRKISRLNRALLKAIGSIILNDSNFNKLLVRDVLVDPSLKSARVWLTGPKDQVELINAKRISIQNQLPRHLKIRETPKLTFLLEDQYLDHMEQLFQALKTNGHESATDTSK